MMPGNPKGSESISVVAHDDEKAKAKMSVAAKWTPSEMAVIHAEVRKLQRLQRFAKDLKGLSERTRR